MNDDPYARLAARLDELPSGYPATPSGVEREILKKLFTAQEADLAARMRQELESAQTIGERLGMDAGAVRDLLKAMVRKGLIESARSEEGLAFGLMPFVVGIYEMQAGRIDAELAELFERYYREGFHRALATKPAVHRVLPVNESIAVDMAIHPYESAADIVREARSWGVVDCICRTQKSLIGEPCGHPIDVCMVISKVPGAFERSETIRALDLDGALDTLQRAAQAGLVHTVSNHQQGHWYVCNCCTCSCGILRGIADFGLADVVARAPFVNHVDEEACQGCGLCIEACQFDALSLNGIAVVDEARCVGCGVCALQCPDEALHLVRRPPNASPQPPRTLADWRRMRAAERGLRAPHAGEAA